MSQKERSTVALATRRTWVTFSVGETQLQEKLNEFEELGFAIVHVMCSAARKTDYPPSFTVVAIRVETLGGTPGKELPAEQPELFDESLGDA